MFKNCILREEDGYDCEMQYLMDCKHPECKYYYKGNWFINLLFGFIFILIWGIILIGSTIFAVIQSFLELFR